MFDIELKKAADELIEKLKDTPIHLQGTTKLAKDAGGETTITFDVTVSL